MINWHRNRFPSHRLYPVLSSSPCKTQTHSSSSLHFSSSFMLSLSLSPSHSRPLMCSGVDGSSLSVRSPATTHNRLTSTKPQPALHFLSSVQWHTRTHLFSHTALGYYSIIHLHDFLSLLLSLSLSPYLPPFLSFSFTCSHLHNIVAGDVFHLFSIRLEGGKSTLPFLSYYKVLYLRVQQIGSAGPPNSRVRGI